ncbi:MAG: hypothetical protein L0Z50_10760, partial [Verrucomicrobiales bacterium]|nr:hypothetical protein [Verrucomicrobiales bacterium]
RRSDLPAAFRSRAPDQPRKSSANLRPALNLCCDAHPVGVVLAAPTDLLLPQPSGKFWLPHRA